MVKNKKGMNRFLPKGKKGAEMTVGTIIIIVLALIVLVVLVVGFTGGWTNLWSRVTSFFGGANVDSVVQACQVACTTEQKYEFCDRMRIIKAEENILVINDTNKNIVPSTTTIGGEIKRAKEGKASCNNLSILYTNLGIAGCSDLCS